MIGRRLVALRALRGLSQKELAALLGMDQSQVSRYEHGRCELGILLALRWARALGCTLNDLVLPALDVTVRTGREG